MQIAVLTITNTGSWASLIALWALAAFKLQSGVGAVALVALAWSVPSILLGGRPGHWIERYGLRRIFLLSQVIGAGSSAFLAFSDQWPQVASAAALLGIARALGFPAMDLLPAATCDTNHLVSSNSLYTLTSDVAMILGSILAAIVLSIGTPRDVFLIDVVTYLLSIGVLIHNTADWPLKVVDRAKSKLGVQYQSRGDISCILIVMSLVYMSWAVFLVVEPVYVEHILDASPSVFAWLQMCYAGAIVLGTLAAPAITRNRPNLRSLCIAVALSGICVGIYVSTESRLIAFIGVGLWGASNAIAIVTSRALLQLHARPEKLATWNRTLYGGAGILALPVLALTGDVNHIQIIGLGVAATVAFGGALAYVGAKRYVVWGMDRKPAP